MKFMRKKSGKRNPTRFSKIIVSCVLAAAAVFTVAMIQLFKLYGAVPDTLIVAFFGFAGGEAGVLGLIKCLETKKKADDGSDDIAKG